MKTIYGAVEKRTSGRATWHIEQARDEGRTRTREHENGGGVEDIAVALM